MSGRFVMLATVAGSEVAMNPDRVVAVLRGQDRGPDTPCCRVFVGGGDEDCFEVAGSVAQVVSALGGLR